MFSRRSMRFVLLSAVACLTAVQARVSSQTTSTAARDPGLRAGPAAAGAPLPGLTPQQAEYFRIGALDFEEVESAADGIGPRMNLDSCGGCHSQPALGGTSPAENPQFRFAQQGRNRIPSFITLDGPVREARFIRNADGTPDGGVHALFTMDGRIGADGCSLPQPDFDAQLAKRNVVFRIPTPVFGAGLMELIPDAAILANRAAGAAAKRSFGIRGRANFSLAGRTISGQTNTNGNDGTIARFGWKAQNKSLLIFSGEAYNVEMGITNDLFPTERDENAGCQFALQPNSSSNLEALSAVDGMSSIEKFSVFMRLLAAPVPSQDTPGGATSIARGRATFAAVGCSLCHTPGFTTAPSPMAALSQKPVTLYSDLLVHDMGIGLADGVTQGSAGPREFRTAPLWGLGQRVFFLHDGRTSDLGEAIRAHASDGSEANLVVRAFAALNAVRAQDLLNFLRSL